MPLLPLPFLWPLMQDQQLPWFQASFSSICDACDPGTFAQIAIDCHVCKQLRKFSITTHVGDTGVRNTLTLRDDNTVKCGNPVQVCMTVLL